MGTKRPEGGVLPALLTLGGAFLFGGVAGCLLAGLVDGGGMDMLNTYLQGWLAAVHSGGTDVPGLVSLIWELVRWPLLAAMLGFTVLGLPGLPVLFAARGFFLAFSIGSFVRMFGPMGGVWAIPIFGVSALFTIPVLFVLGVEGWARLRGSPVAGSRPLRYLFCAAVLCVCVLVEYFLVPSVLTAIAGFMTA